MTLLKETISVLEQNGKTTGDVVWCGSTSFGWFNWDDFSSVADVEYDSGFGEPEVAQDLIISGNDFWLERYEYDGAEHWEFKTNPKKPENYMKPKALTVGAAEKLEYNVSCGWEDLIAINGGKK